MEKKIGSSRRPGKLESIDKRFALVDHEGELRYPYKISSTAADRYGFAVGPDRVGEATHFDDLRDAIRAVVFDGRTLRVTVDPPTRSKGSNAVSLHQLRTVQGYVIDESLRHLVAEAPIPPMGSPDTYPRPESPIEPGRIAVWGILRDAHKEHIAGASGPMVRKLGWQTVAMRIEERPNTLPRVPLLLVEEASSEAVTWVADVVSVETRTGPSALINIENLVRLQTPIAMDQLVNLHTGLPLVGSDQTDIPCLMSEDAADAVARRTTDQVEALHPEAFDVERQMESDPALAGESVTNRIALANARVGQGGYRSRMLALWNSQCAVTACSIDRVLIASHAKPWAASTNAERLDAYNGLLLSASVDRLFDAGLISFDDDGAMLVAPGLTDSDLQSVGLSRSSRLRRIFPPLLPYLSMHRHMKFKGTPVYGFSAPVESQSE